jgi:hypothetical protein
MPKPKTDQELVDAFSNGIAERAHTTVHSQLGDFVIFKIAGHKAWSGVGCPWEYVQTQYVLIRKGDWWMGQRTVKREWQGRVKAADLKEALKRSILTKEVYTADLDVPMCEECDIPMHRGEGLDGNKVVEYFHCDECGWSVDI